MPEEEDKKSAYLQHEEVKTMQKDVAALREVEAKQEREKISQIKTAEEIQKEQLREQEAQKAAEERKLAEEAAVRREEEMKRTMEERKKQKVILEKEGIAREGERAEGFKEAMRETQIREEEERKRFLERVAAKAEGLPANRQSEVTPPSPSVLPPLTVPKKEIPKPFIKRTSFFQKLGVRIILIILVLVIIAAIVGFWYWYLNIREKPAPLPPSTPPVAEEVVPEVIEAPPVTERILGGGYNIPATPRIIDAIIIHSTYNVFSEDPHSVEGIIQEYQYYKVASHYLIDRDSTMYRLAPDESIAYHAGTSQMPDGRTNVNDFSIGVELIQTKTESPTEAQYQALAQLVKYLKQEYNIPSENILGHKDVSPDRKTDPWNFDWEKFNQLIQ